jgi:hypothetical protein
MRGRLGDEMSSERKERGEEAQQGEESKQIVSLKGNGVSEKTERNVNNNDTKCILHAFRAFEFYCFRNISPIILPQVGSSYVPWVLYSAILVFSSPLFISSEAQRLRKFQARC